MIPNKIIYFNRNKEAGYSIKNVTDPYINQVKKFYSVKEVFMPRATAGLCDIITNLFHAIKNRDKKAINHITGDVLYCALVLPPKNTIITVHDLCLLEYHSYSKIKRIIYFIFWIYLPLRRCKIITCFSLKTKTELLKYCPKIQDKIVVIHNPIADAFSYKGKEFNTGKPLILHIGTRSNKNLERVICAIKGLNVALRIIGDIDENQLKLLCENKIDYSVGAHLTNSEIIVEYIKSDIVSFPTLYEGFGMPIIEGQKIGRPVLSSNIDPIIEISDGSALLIDPFDISSIRNGFIKIIEDPYFRNDLIIRGIANSRRFDSMTIAKRYIELYKKI